MCLGAKKLKINPELKNLQTSYGLPKFYLYECRLSPCNRSNVCQRILLCLYMSAFPGHDYYTGMQLVACVIIQKRIVLNYYNYCSLLDNAHD